MPFAMLAVLQESEFTLRELISDIPHDASAFFIYLFTALSLYLIWKGSKTRA